MPVRVGLLVGLYCLKKIQNAELQQHPVASVKGATRKAACTAEHIRAQAYIAYRYVHSRAKRLATRLFGPLSRNVAPGVSI